MGNKSIEKFAEQIRYITSKMFIECGDGHIGGAFSITETVAVIFEKYMQEDSNDWFVLSKVHAGPAYYAALYLKGKIPKEVIFTLNENGTSLPSHPDRNKTKGVQVTTGSLGQGISQAAGIAYGLKVQNKKGWVYCIVGDGECNEGEVFEALQFISGKKLTNLILFIDWNKKQVDGLTEKISCKIDYEKLLTAMNFNALKINGHDVAEIEKAIETCKKQSKANVIILDTIKGYGIDEFSSAENPHHVKFNENEINVLKKYIESKREVFQT